MKNKIKGFTLVELLAVIVILAIILVIAVPKVMSVIEDSKKATLESTAKMIASAAEKSKVQNTVLSKDKEINCEDVVKLNNIDYERCIIEFDNNNNALVSIKGKGKFSNLNVCSGDKATATASSGTCSVEYGNSATYIEKLEAFNGSLNGLIVDDTADKNIRYVGSNPNNKVYFNCEDIDSNGVSYGDENYDYASSCEVWRIIGVFEVDNGEGKLEKRVKLVNINSTFIAGFDSSINTINSGYGINQWGPSTYEDGSVYEGADLMQLLNGYYIGESTSCTYCLTSGLEICDRTCTYESLKSVNMKPITNISKNMVGISVWYLSSKEWHSGAMTAESYYINERDNSAVKKCESDIECNDKVNRTTEWTGRIGLIFPSDFGYASSDLNCKNDIYGEDSTCENNNWLFLGKEYWTITPFGWENSLSNGFEITSSGNVNNNQVRIYKYILASLYLSSNVEIIGGDGATTPYKLR